MNTSGFPGGTLTNDPQVSALWEKLRWFSFDGGGGPRAFAVRLASEQNWSAAFTALAIEEYRRFLLLFALEQKRQDESRPAVQIVPSEVVDKVWHLHLLYTRSYWETLCRDILGKPLHHLPADGSGGEAASLSSVYRATLEAYRQTFGHPAPGTVWPDAGEPKKLPASAAAVLPAIVGRGSSAPLRNLSWTVWMPAAVGVPLILIYLVSNGLSTTTVMQVVACCVGGSIVLIGTYAILNPDTGSGGAVRRRRAARRAGFLGSCGGGCAGGTSGDSGTYTHHDGFHHGSGSHDGGHGDSGGHSCGGHSCGGHGCGGHGCGGGH